MLKIKHIKHANIDFDKWDKTILSSRYPLVFAQSFYLNATSPNWDALVIGDYESIFPLTSKKKLGFNYLPQPSFTSQLGVYGKVTTEIETVFYNYITEKFKLIEIELNASNNLQTKDTTIKKTFIIDYKTHYEYNQNTKRNIKKACVNGIVVKQVKTADIMKLSKKWLNPFLEKELKLSKSVVKTFNTLLLAAISENYLLTYQALDKNNAIKALAHFIYNGKHALYLKGTNFDKKENSGSMHLLIDTAINYFEDKTTIFDFGGGSQIGLASFYQGLGGKPLNYNLLKINKLPKLVTLLKNKIK